MQQIRRWKDSKDKLHIVNAVKYSTAFFVNGFAVMRASQSDAKTAGFYLWLFFIIVSTVYTFYWDIIQDWSLGNR
jgi:predicted ABC-type ATPase